MRLLTALLIICLGLGGCTTTPQQNISAPTGTVVLEFVINELGHVEDVLVVSSTHPEFNQPAIEAVSKWQFKPAKKNGQPVKVRASQTIEFNLIDGPGSVKRP